MNLDFNDRVNRAMFSANNAVQAFESRENLEYARRAVDEHNRQMAENESILVAGAEASIDQRELLAAQLEIIQKQNELLADNYGKLKELYDAQVQATKEAKEDLVRSRRYNIGMMLIAIIAMLAAVAGPVITLFK